MAKLRECPFCGSKRVGSEIDRYSFLTLYGNYKIYCYCKECGGRGPSKPFYDEAAEAWNRRKADG